MASAIANGTNLEPAGTRQDRTDDRRSLGNRTLEGSNKDPSLEGYWGSHKSAEIGSVELRFYTPDRSGGRSLFVRSRGQKVINRTDAAAHFTKALGGPTHHITEPPREGAETAVSAFQAHFERRQLRCYE